jgi:hypothetical protein
VADSSIIYLVQTTPEWPTLKASLIAAANVRRSTVRTWSAREHTRELEVERLDAFEKAVLGVSSLTELSKKLAFGTLQGIPGGMWIVRSSEYACYNNIPDPAGRILTEVLRGHEVTRVYH